MPWRRIFGDRPPTDDELVKTLFVGRERELQDASDTYEGAGADHGKVMVIHGERRSGKSHLARRMIVKLKDEKEPLILVQANANERKNADNLLRRIYNDLAEKLLSTKIGARASQERKDVFDFAQAHVQTILDLLRTGNPSVTVEHTRGAIERMEQRIGTRVETGIKGRVLSFISAHVRGEITRSRAAGQEESQQDRTSYTLSAPSGDGLAREIGFLASTLVYLQRNKKRVLLFIDDMDLLSYGPQATDAELEMAGHLSTLASEEAIHVIATVRSDLYAKRESHFGELCEPLGPMTREELQEVYRRRVQIYAGGQQFFTADALGLLATGAAGLVGDFLGFGYRAYRSLRHDSKIPSGTDVERYFAGRWDYVAGRIPAQAAQQIQQRISQGVVEVAGADLREEGFDPATSSLFAEGVIKSVPYQADQYRISPMFVEAIRTKLSTEGAPDAG